MYVRRDCALVSVVVLLAVLMVAMPHETTAGRVIFYAPIRRQIVTGQILSSSAKAEPCEKCFMRDHRGQCRRMLSFSVDGIRC